MSSTVSIENRIVAVLDLSQDRDYQLASLAEQWLLRNKLIQGSVSLQYPMGTPIKPNRPAYECPCQCHCGAYDCDECWENSSTESCTESGSVAESQEQTVLILYPKEVSLEKLDGLLLRQTNDGMEIVKVSHKESSYYMFWTQQSVQIQILAELLVKPVQPL